MGAIAANEMKSEVGFTPLIFSNIVAIPRRETLEIGFTYCGDSNPDHLRDERTLQPLGYLSPPKRDEDMW